MFAMNETRKRCAELLIENDKLNAIQRRTYGQIAEEVGIPYTHVSSLASELRAKGILKERNPRRQRTDAVKRSDRGQRIAVPIEFRDPEAAQILKEIEHKEFIDADDRRKVLSLLIKASTDEVRVRAISLLESIESAQDKQLGPPPPANHEQRVERLATLMSVVGRKVVDDAISKAVFEEAPPPENPKLPEASDSSMDGRSSESGG